MTHKRCSIQIDNHRVSSNEQDGYYLVHCCVDGGVCHNNCGAGCFRKQCCVPLSVAGHFLDDDWQPIKATTHT
ncbi:hypothetical protein DFR44_13029 [Hydromonas duriensis]|uniref:Uncharacterized protein n=1 Tax=Hydromonas duriensis TaxID=1527608 RepID=A0A4R6Y4L0_9BURK|nr:hypothetical protein DFR44_13029 [Hydromonas duriensis]